MGERKTSARRGTGAVGAACILSAFGSAFGLGGCSSILGIGDWTGLTDDGGPDSTTGPNSVTDGSSASGETGPADASSDVRVGTEAGGSDASRAPDAGEAGGAAAADASLDGASAARDGGGAASDAGVDAAEAGVDAANPQLCMAGGGVSVLVQGHAVTAYVAGGSYTEPLTGIFAVPLEAAPSGSPLRYAPSLPSPTSISTGPNAVNSCATNSQTGAVVCTTNGNTIYAVDGTVASALQAAVPATNGATGFETFSGGDCETCSVAIDPIHNMAYFSIATGNDTGGLGSTGAALQPYDLTQKVFQTPIQTGTGSTSENILVDPIRGLILSPEEGDPTAANDNGNYQLINPTSLTASSFLPPNGVVGGVLESAAEDCETGIALASDEFSSDIFLVDLSQAVFHGSNWTAGAPMMPVGYAFINFPELNATSANQAGAASITVAPGSHVGVVGGTFGGNTIVGFKLPSTAGSGTPALVDYVAATMPSSPDNVAWSFATAPHALTAYQSPNSGQPYAVFVDDPTPGASPGTRTFLAIVDLNALLARARNSADAHMLQVALGAGDTCTTVDTTTGANPAGCVVRFVGRAANAGGL